MSLPGELETLRAIARAEPPAGSLPAETRRALGVRWAERAHNETRTSAAFVEIARCLEECGASVELVAVARKGTEDEARHGRECAVASEYYAGEPVTFDAPGSVRRARFGGCTPRESSVLYVTLECAIFESIACVYLQRCLDTAETELTRAVNRNLLRDEVRHARLGFGFLAQLGAEDRTLVEHALPKLVETTLEQWLDPTGYPEIPSGHGCLPHEELVETVISALGDLTLPGFEEVGISTRATQALLSRAPHFGSRSTLPTAPSFEVTPK